MASYAKGNYDFDNLEKIEEFVVFMGAYEITAVLKNINDASYKSENYVILGYCLNYYSDNPHITEFLERTYPKKKILMPCWKLWKKKYVKKMTKA